ncbi:MAG TPA: hypothetical protein VG053_12370 [Solirubrobacteraceae bacterium]|nr:hypothetical protein [Solirubrobacteraceae bacterium]
MYVADLVNNRVQEFTPTGRFVLMFGWNVNKTEIEASAPQAERDICTAVSKDECQAGEEGTGLAGQMALPQDIAIDPVTGDVYVAELGRTSNHNRIEEYTPEGKFVLMVGGNVNKTKVEAAGTEAERNLCTAESKDECQAGEFAPHALSSQLPTGVGDLMAVGGPEGLLYIGNGQDVREFKTDGEYKRELSLASISTEKSAEAQALALAGNGDIYVVVGPNGSQVVHELNPNGEQIGVFTTPGAVWALALDPLGRLAVHEGLSNHGVLYSATGEALGTFAPPGGMISADSFAFNGEDELFVADPSHQDVEMYAPAPVLEPMTDPAACVMGAGIETSATFNCTFTGAVNPKSVADTRVWFQYGVSEALGSSTAAQPVAAVGTVLPVEAIVDGLRPNQTYYERLVGEDENTGGEAVTGGTLSFTTPAVPPAIVDPPGAFDVTFSSAVFSGVLNPENAKTVYRYQYGVSRQGSCETLGHCAQALESPALESSAYGAQGVTLSVAELAPASTYLVRLVAVNEHGEETDGPETSFQTPAAPSPTAITGAAGGVGATTATLTGVVNPDGADASYSFQVGIYNGASTVYGTIVTGLAGEGTQPQAQEFTLTGLQPGVTYAYRIALSSAYAAGGRIYGEPVLFTTTGLPSVLLAPTPLAMLAIPNIAFPSGAAPVTPKQATKKSPAAKKKRTKRRTKPKKGKRAARKSSRRSRAH